MTKTEIIQAAFKTWGAGAYHTTSLSALAGALGVTKTALYHHFRNKDDILAAMREAFFNHLADGLRPFFEKSIDCMQSGAGKTEIIEAAIFINSGITDFFVKNPLYFMFSLIKIHGSTDAKTCVHTSLLERGIDFTKIQRLADKFDEKKLYPPLYQLIFTCSFCIIAIFLKVLWTGGGLESGDPSKPPLDALMIAEKVNAFVRHGLGFSRETIDALDWDAMEKAAVWRETGGGGGRRKWLLKAAASVVAAAGPWAASMSMVARKSGLSKSGLYAHFASKGEMLRQLFLEEFSEVIQHSQAVSRKSGVPEEQLYLAIRAVEGFLTSEPEFLAAISSLKTRHINFDMDKIENMAKSRLECTTRFFQVFSEIKNVSGKPLIDETFTGVILFLLVDTLVSKPDSMDYKVIPDESFRMLYRFIALGTDGAK